jgi:SAM-dependent methyltransferase
MHGIPGTYSYRRCRSCRTVFQDPQVTDEDVALLYPRTYYTHAAPSGESPAGVRGEGEPGFRGRVRAGIQRVQAPGREGPPPSAWSRLLAVSRWMRERAFYDLVDDEMLPWRTPPGRALDVGCGSGFWMLRLAALGWEVAGVEPDEAAAAVARERTGAEVRVAGVATLRREDVGTFDLVTLSHVLEHLPAPGHALRVLGGLLSPGGRLVVLWPNPDALVARAFRAHWFAWDAPRHLVLPSLRALRPLMADTGLEVRRARTFTRSAADHAMQSASYQRGGGVQTGVPGFWHRGLGGLERALVALGLDVGEEILLHLELRT